MKPGATIGALVALLGCSVDAAADPVVDTARGDRMIAAYFLAHSPAYNASRRNLVRSPG